MSIGNKIKTLRKLANMTQVELAQKLGRSESMIRKYESDSVTPNIEILKKIAEIFNVSVRDIVTEEGTSYIVNQNTGDHYIFNTPKVDDLAEDKTKLKLLGLETKFNLEIGNAVNEYIAYITPKSDNDLATKEKADQLLKKIAELIEYETYKEKNKK